MQKHGLNVHHFIVLLMAISYLNLALAHGYEFLTYGRHNAPTTKQQKAEVIATDAKTININPVTPEISMNTKVLQEETAVGQSQPATINDVKSTAEVHS